MNKRVRRPPDNPMNAMISFGNSILYSKTVTQIYHTHLDQRISFLHEPSEARFSLSLDLCEAFKPLIVFRTIFDLVNNGKIKVDKHFDKKLNYCILNEEGKKVFIENLEARFEKIIDHGKLKRKVSYIADEFNMTKATISETIKTLEQKELIHKEYEERDSRSYIIQLSNKGKEIAKKTSLFTKELGAPIHKLPNKEKENLLLNLLDIIRHLNNTGVISIQRMCKSCTYYQSTNKGKKHYCHLLNQALTAKDLRLDCPEHELKL